MAFSSSGVQTGTDTDLSGLSSVTSHESRVIGGGVATVTEHTIGTVLDVTGDLTISPEIENLLCSHIIIRNGATLTIEGTILRDGNFVRYSEKDAITCTRISGSFENDAGLLIESGGTIIHRGGFIRCNAPIVTNNCNYVLAGAIVEQFNGGGSAQWRHQGTTFSLDAGIDAGSSGLILRGTDLTVIGGNIPPRYQPQGMQAAFGWSSGTPNIDFIVESPNLTDLTTTRHTAFWRGNRPIFRNGFYTTINAGPHIRGNASSYGTAVVETDITIQPKDLQNNNVDARIFRRASVLGKQVDYTQEGHFVDGTSDIVTNRLVSEGEFSYRTRVNNINRGNGDAENTGNYAWGYYGDNATDEGSLNHTFQIRSYGLVASSLTIQEGQGSISEAPVLLPNSNVVSTLAQAQSALASLTIDLDNLTIDVDAPLSAQRIHDALDLWMTQANQQEIDYFFNISGSTLTLSNGWEISASTNTNVIGSLIDVNGSLITITSPNGLPFNILARRADTGAEFAYQHTVLSASFQVPAGVELEVAAWQLGKQTSLFTTQSSTSISFVDHTVVDIDIDTSPFTGSIDLSLAPNDFGITFNQSAVFDIELMKAIIHKLLGRENSLRAGLLAGAGSSSIEILSDEIRINLPIVFVRRGTALTVAERVELSGFLNIAPARALNPLYIPNPNDANNQFVLIPSVKPALDPSQLAKAVWDETRGALTLDHSRAANIQTRKVSI